MPTTNQPPAVARIDSVTETRNPRTTEIDTLDTRGVVGLIHQEDLTVAASIEHCLDDLARLVDLAVDAWRAGKTIRYFGAGTSGRLAVMDAAELPPTFSVDAERVVAYHAGGMQAADQAIESAEDQPQLGRDAASEVEAGDIVIGVAASGRTPFVRGAIELANDRGATTALISARPGSPIGDLVDIDLAAQTGPEVITGSTRMKAGTAQKLLLNTFSTALMIRLGKTYSNFMISVSPSNAKLRGRVLAMLEEASGTSPDDVAAALAAVEGDTKAALVSLITGIDAAAAIGALDRHDGVVRHAIDDIHRSQQGETQ